MKESKNKGKLPLFAAVCFYVAAGAAACIMLFLKDSPFSNRVALNDSSESREEFSGAASGTDSDGIPSDSAQPSLPESGSPESSGSGVPETAPQESGTSESASRESEESKASDPASPESEEPKASDPASPEDTAVYYAFTTKNTKGWLNVRKSGSMEARAITSLPPGTAGYVLERGPVWSRIQAGSITGYVFNEYLEFREISKEEYLENVQAP